MDNEEYTDLYDHDLADGGKFNKRKMEWPPKKNQHKEFQDRLYEKKSPNLTKKLTNTLDQLRAESNYRRLEVYLSRVDEELAKRIRTAEENGVNFNRPQQVREWLDNGGIMDDFNVLVSRKTFSHVPDQDLYLMGRWHRWGRNCWGHENYVYALGYPREFYSAMIHLTGQHVLNLPDLHTSLKDELTRSQLTERTLLELSRTPKPN